MHHTSITCRVSHAEIPGPNPKSLSESPTAAHSPSPSVSLIKAAYGVACARFEAHSEHMQVWAAICIAVLAVIVLAAYLARYEIAPASGSVVYRLDRWTGQIQLCSAHDGKLTCK